MKSTWESDTASFGAQIFRISPSHPIITEPYIDQEELIMKWANILGTERNPVIGINWKAVRQQRKLGFGGVQKN